MQHVSPSGGHERLTTSRRSVGDELQDAIVSFTLRLRTASLGEPQQALDVADHSAKRLFDTLPIHASMRALDEEVVYGAVRFRMIAVSQEMQRRFAAAHLVKQFLIGAAR